MEVGVEAVVEGVVVVGLKEAVGVTEVALAGVTLGRGRRLSVSLIARPV